MIVRNILKTICVVIWCVCGACLLSENVAAQTPQEEFVIGVLPTRDAEGLQKAYTPILKYLAKALNRPTRMAVSENYGQLGEWLASGDVSLAFLGPVLYVETKAKYPDKIHYLATCMRETNGENHPFYYGFFLVNANSPYQSLHDLKGKKWAFTEKQSSSGYIYPMVFFTRKEIDPFSYFGEVKFLQKHYKITDALAAWKAGAENEIDGGATYNGNLYEAEAKYGKIFRIIAQVGPIPLDLAAVSSSVLNDKELTAMITQALVNAPHEVTHAEGVAWNGWHLGSDADFDIVRKSVEITEKEKGQK